MQIERSTYNPQFFYVYSKVAIPTHPLPVLTWPRVLSLLWHSRCQTDHASASLASDRGVKRRHLEWTPTVLHGLNVSFLFKSAPDKNVVIFKMLVAKIVRNRNFRTSLKIWRTRAVYSWVIRSSTLHTIASANKLRLWKRQFEQKQRIWLYTTNKNTPPPPEIKKKKKMKIQLKKNM